MTTLTRPLTRTARRIRATVRTLFWAAVVCAVAFLGNVFARAASGSARDVLAVVALSTILWIVVVHLHRTGKRR